MPYSSEKGHDVRGRVGAETPEMIQEVAEKKRVEDAFGAVFEAVMKLPDRGMRTSLLAELRDKLDEINRRVSRHSEESK